MLKKIEIYGFKSFAEKTVIEFEDAINGIVGPNGSGKSNIVDAIKWCLGEQSLKDIRAKAPTDVIFAGSESKAPLNYCEVTIVFDNQRGSLPISYEEVEITRRIYRNGETEYYLNRTPCRLKDIKEILLDTGFSADSYSIIPQGKVEFVVSAKPEERRLLFEETAGIVKYKVKREEALRKLERVKLDMARIEDILSYLKEQMASLEQAVKKAKNYNKIKQELQMFECAYMVKNIEEIDKELKNVEGLYLELSTEYTPLCKDITENEQKLVDIKLEVSELEKEFLKFKDHAHSLETEISLTTQKIESYKEEIVKSQDYILKLQEEIEEINIKNETYQKEIKQLQDSKANLEDNLDDLKQKKDVYEQEYLKYKQEIDKQRQLLQDKNKILTEISYNRAKFKNDFSLVSKEINRLQIELHSLQKDLQNLNKDMLQTKQQLEEQEKEISFLKDKKEKLSVEIDEINKKLLEINNGLNEVNNILQDKNREFYNLTSKIENINANFSPYGINKIIKYLQENNLLDLCIPIKSIIKVSKHNESLISSYLGSKLYWLVVENELIAYKIIDIIKENKLGFATFVIKEKLSQIKDRKINKVDKKILELVEYDSKWEEVVEFVFSDVILEEDILKTNVLLHSGRFDNLYEEEQDLYSLEIKINIVSDEIKKLNDYIKELSEQHKNIVELKNKKELELISLETKIEEILKEKTEKEQLLFSFNELENSLKNNFSNIQSQIKDYEKQLQQLELKIKYFDEEEKKIREEVDKLVSLISQLQSNKVMDEYLQITSLYAKTEEQLNRVIYEIDTKDNLIKTNFKKVENYMQQIKDTQNYIEKIKNDIIKNEDMLKKLLEEKQKVVAAINEKISNIEEKKNIIFSLEQEIKQKNLKKEEIQQKLTEIEIQKNNLLNNKTNYINWLLEKYSISFEEAKELYGQVKDVDYQQIEKLKKRLESMGAINLAAPEEYAQLEEKYNLLVSQQQDLLKSHQDLKDAISRINQQISINFKETFLKVKENFIKLCKILFEGGNADLILTNEENVLESGIEIFVQPPGKKHQNINLLSGGEKSLVAFALLFAFFMVKPSPVCILDEADAQLDETNVVRFMKLLKEFSKDTKFILITHNTRTMEFLDTLYGVTMEELGVSKILALRLKKVEVVAM